MSDTKNVWLSVTSRLESCVVPGDQKSGSLLLLRGSARLCHFTSGLTSKRRATISPGSGGLRKVLFLLIYLQIQVIVPAVQRNYICSSLSSPAGFLGTARHFVGLGELMMLVGNQNSLVPQPNW